MKLATGVIGYVRDDAAILEEGGCRGHADIVPDVEIPEIFARIQAEDVIEVRQGAAREGWRLVQVILAEESKVETIDNSRDRIDAIPFNDPVLNKLRADATAKVIMI